MGAQPVRDALGQPFPPGSVGLTDQCTAIVAAGVTQPLVCSREALAHVLRTIGYQRIGDLIGIAAFVALPSVVLMMMFGQTRIFFVMARDGLLPDRLASVHPRFHTPHVVTAVTGIGVDARGRLPAGRQARRLFELGHVVRVRDGGDLGAGAAPHRSGPQAGRSGLRRSAIVAPLAIIGCVALYFMLPLVAKLVLPVWGAVGSADLLRLFAQPQPCRPRDRRRCRSLRPTRRARSASRRCRERRRRAVPKSAIRRAVLRPAP